MLNQAELEQRRAAKLEQEAKERLANEAITLKVGDVVVEQWGYSMCLVNFYKVIALNGKTMVTLQELEAERVTGDGWQGQMQPSDTLRATQAPFKRRVTRSYDGRPVVKVRSHSRAYPHEAGKTYFYDTCD